MTAAPNGLGGLAGKVEANWKDLVDLADKGLKKKATAGLQGAVEKVKTSADTLSVAPWSGPTWATLPDAAQDDGWTTGVLAATGIPMVRLSVRTPHVGDYDDLVRHLDELPDRAMLALDRLALDGVPAASDGEQPEEVTAPQPPTMPVPPIVRPPAAVSLTAAIGDTSGDRVVLHRNDPLPKAAKDAIASALGATKPVHCPALATRTPFLMLVPDRVQLQVSQEWTLAYLPVDNGNRVALELSIVAAYRARPRSAAFFKRAT